MGRYLLITFSILYSTLCVAEKLSPYVGEENREIKSMSKSQAEGYRLGKGMGFAKAAELNGYPGPRHVLDLSKQLNLTTEQIAKSNNLFVKMQSEAAMLGSSLIGKEADLELLFSSGSVNHESLKESLAAIATIKAKIRKTHLATHIEQKTLLTAHQVSLYTKHRGYGTSHKNHGNH